MRRLLFICIMLFLAGCQRSAASPTPVPATSSAQAAAPTIAATAIAGGQMFDGFKMFTARSGWAWSGVSQLYRTDDGGATWTEIHLQGKRLVTGAAYLSADEAWLPGVPDANITAPVYHTADGGKTWQALGALKGPNIELHFADASHGWALNGVGAAGNVFYDVYRTTDGGASWTRLDVAPRAGESQGAMPGTLHVATGDTVSFSLPDSIWITSGYGIATPYAGLTVSRDGGQTWQEINPPLAADLVKDQPPVTVAAPQFVGDADAFLPVTAGFRLVFFGSHDGGNSWSLLRAVLPSSQSQPHAQFVNQQDGFAVCGGALCVTHDGAASWQQVPGPFSYEAVGNAAFAAAFDFIDANTGWALLDEPNGGRSLVKTTDGGRTWIALHAHFGF